MKIFCKNRPHCVTLRSVRLFVFSMLCVCVYGLIPVAAQYAIDQNLETHALGAVTVSGASRENCAAWSQCNSGVCPVNPLIVSSNYAREGSKSLRFEFDKNNFILHADGYCALRNEIRWNVDLNHGEEAWYGFSILPTLGEDGSVKYNSSGDAWICQIKNECGSGNRGGLQIKGDNFYFDGNNLATVNYNQWNDIIIHYKYHSSEGFRRIWIQGVQVLSQSYNTATTSCKIDFKIGMYGWQPNGKSILYFDAIKVKIGTGSYSDVAPTQQPSVAATGVREVYRNTTSSRQGNLVIDMRSFAMDANVHVYDVLGKCVYQRSHASGVFTIKHTLLGTAGLYIVKIDNRVTSVTRRFDIAR